MFKSKLTKQTIINLCFWVTVLLVGMQAVSAQINIGGISIPKIKRQSQPKTNQPDNKPDNKPPGTTAGSRNESGVPEDVETNPHAPSDYSANLNIGDQAVAVDHFRNVSVVKILAKSGSSYKVAELNGQGSGRWYGVNSVYPYFDKQGFDEIMYNYKRYVTPYLPCYGKKHNLGETQVTDEGYNAFGARRFDNADDARKELQPEQAKLAELEGLLKSKLGGNAPNTYLDYSDNPAIVSEIAAQRADYLKCVVSAEEDKPDFRLSIFLDDIKKARGEVEQYTPETMLYLVSAGASSEELVLAVSHKAREAWSQQWLKNAASRAEFNAAWDDLAAAAAKKIPLYKPSAESYKYHFPAGEKLLMESFKNTSTLKIFRIGTDTAGWDIQKDDSNFPKYRYKDVNVYFRDSSDDHPYCRVVTARVKQDYAGGGAYNSSIYRSSVSEEIFGCP